MKALRLLGIQTVIIGTQTGDKDDYAMIEKLCDEGTQELFDRIVNALLEYKQDHSPVGYKYM